MSTYKINYIDRTRYVFEVEADNEAEAVTIATSENASDYFIVADEFIMGPVISVQRE